jgi:hypothetical protein
MWTIGMSATIQIKTKMVFRRSDARARREVKNGPSGLRKP